MHFVAKLPLKDNITLTHFLICINHEAFELIKQFLVTYVNLGTSMFIASLLYFSSIEDESTQFYISYDKLLDWLKYYMLNRR